jgi:hypothetical protein
MIPQEIKINTYSTGIPNQNTVLLNKDSKGKLNNIQPNKNRLTRRLFFILEGVMVMYIFHIKSPGCRP